MSETYGIGDSTKKANVGGLVNEVTKQDDEGRTFVGEEKTFDPTEDSVELIQDDGMFPDEIDGLSDKDKEKDENLA